MFFAYLSGFLQLLMTVLVILDCIKYLRTKK